MAHVSLITLGVDDLERATRFYTALGWRRSSSSVEGEITFLAGGTVALALFGRDALAADARVHSGGSGHGDVALAMNLSSEHAVDETLLSAVRAGGQITKAAERADWGGYSGYLLDVDGHLWEVAHNPFFPLSEDGRITLPETDD